MAGTKAKLHEIVDALTDEQAERALEALEDPTFFLDEAPAGIVHEDEPGFWEEIERRAEKAREGAGSSWEEVRARLLGRSART